MLISDLIVYVWLVPVVLFIVVPLSLLCAWSVHRLMRRITGRIEQAHLSAKAAHKKAPVQRFRPRPAV
ncbi:MAG: hypothetical protein ACR2PB_08195 [Desulfocapsaceae bacterium]